MMLSVPESINWFRYYLPACLAAWDVVHGPPTASTLEVSLSSFWPGGVHGVCPLPPLLAPCTPGDVALDFVHGLRCSTRKPWFGFQEDF